MPQAKYNFRTREATPEFKAWCNMKCRCRYNYPKYRKYHERGTKVCPQWENNYEQFLHDVGSKPTLKHWLERIDNNGHYEPGNVTWALPHDQLLNREITRFLTFEGRTQTMDAWAKETGISRDNLRCRIDKYGWSVERALTTPTMLEYSHNTKQKQVAV